ncbi:GNAT family N-acetyltransferase [Umezawaea sp. Da 62-37]|uniref:GNAT family N-acetyltransferase n=1 Tax=Umezawaea sp. Da 62-37 TaxID=3075927 RepID=UPI0028F745F8|nr:GNAT family N-acetyltransferase [Umezawaea sp. Da 62-37]WNV89773.1 GNAT family N-acetyltransferase [Umezawaea sp. Da 62-37]
MADAAVRPAQPEDVAEIARIHLATWRTAYAELLPPAVFESFDAAEAEQAWADAVEHAHVFLATEGAWVVGFVVAGSAPDQEVAGADGSMPADFETTALVSTLLVEPRWGRRGHGGRLIATAAHALRDQGASRAVAWVPEADRATKSFYERVGWAADGTVRTLDAGGRPLREIRMTGGLALLLRP